MLMPEHELLRQGRFFGGKHKLSWDDNWITLLSPDGELVFRMPIERAHRIVELYDLYIQKKVSFRTTDGTVTFKYHKAAVRDVKELIANGLRNDAEFRAEQKAVAQRNRVIG